MMCRSMLCEFCTLKVCHRFANEGVGPYREVYKQILPNCRGVYTGRLCVLDSSDLWRGDSHAGKQLLLELVRLTGVVCIGNGRLTTNRQ